MLEIGVGSAANLPLYTGRATEVVGLEPHPRLLMMASENTGRVAVDLIEGSAESIPLEDSSVDTVVTTWTFALFPMSPRLSWRTGFRPMKGCADGRTVRTPSGKRLLAAAI